MNSLRWASEIQPAALSYLFYSRAPRDLQQLDDRSLIWAQCKFVL